MQGLDKRGVHVDGWSDVSSVSEWSVLYVLYILYTTVPLLTRPVLSVLSRRQIRRPAYTNILSTSHSDSSEPTARTPTLTQHRPANHPSNICNAMNATEPPRPLPDP